MYNIESKSRLNKVPAYIKNILNVETIRNSANIVLLLGLLTTGRLMAHGANMQYANPETPACSGAMFGHEFIEMSALEYPIEPSSIRVATGDARIHEIGYDVFDSLDRGQLNKSYSESPTLPDEVSYAVSITDLPDCQQKMEIRVDENLDLPTQFSQVVGFVIEPREPTSKFSVDPFEIDTHMSVSNNTSGVLEVGIIIAFQGATPDQDASYWYSEPLVSGENNIDVAEMTRWLLNELTINGINPGPNAISAVVLNFSAIEETVQWTLADTMITAPHIAPVPTPVPTSTSTETPTSQPGATRTPTRTATFVTTATPTQGLPTPTPNGTLQPTVTTIPGYFEGFCSASEPLQIVGSGNVQLETEDGNGNSWIDSLSFYSPTEHGPGNIRLIDVPISPNREYYLFGWFAYLNSELKQSNRTTVVRVYRNGVEVFQTRYPYSEHGEGWNKVPILLVPKGFSDTLFFATVDISFEGDSGDVAGMHERVNACTEQLIPYTPTPTQTPIPTNTATPSATPTPLPTCAVYTPGPTPDYDVFPLQHYLPNISGGVVCQTK